LANFFETPSSKGKKRDPSHCRLCYREENDPRYFFDTLLDSEE
jgi:hypothetical protein